MANGIICNMRRALVVVPRVQLKGPTVGGILLLKTRVAMTPVEKNVAVATMELVTIVVSKILES
jgi:hypothetical protein